MFSTFYPRVSSSNLKSSAVRPQSSTVKSWASSLRASSPSPVRPKTAQSPKAITPRARTASERVASPARDHNQSGNGPTLSSRLAESNRIANRNVNRLASRSLSSRGNSDRDNNSRCSSASSYRSTGARSGVVDRDQQTNQSDDAKCEYLSRSLDRSRPKTAETSVSNRTQDLDDSDFDDKIFTNLKVALNKALVENGSIDQNNIEEIMQGMKRQLKFGDETDQKESTKLNSSSNSHSKPDDSSAKRITQPKRSPLAGIIRRARPADSRSKQNTYRRMYPPEEPSAPHSDLADVKESEELIYVHLPDAENHFMKDHDQECQQREHFSDRSSKFNSQKQVATKEEIGDCQSKSQHQPFSFWKAAEETKLGSCLEYLVRKLNEEMCHSKQPQVGHHTEDTDCGYRVCTSFCLCKVCVSKRDVQQMSAEQQHQSLADHHQRNRPRITSVANKCAQARDRVPTKNDVNNNRTDRKSTSVRDSKMSVSTARYSRSDLRPRDSYVIMPTEETDDKFLKRRASKGVMGRR